MALVGLGWCNKRKMATELAYGHLVEMVMPRLRAVVGGVLVLSEADDCIQEALLSGWNILVACETRTFRPGLLELPAMRR